MMKKEMTLNVNSMKLIPEDKAPEIRKKFLSDILLIELYDGRKLNEPAAKFIGGGATLMPHLFTFVVSSVFLEGNLVKLENNETKFLKNETDGLLIGIQTHEGGEESVVLYNGKNMVRVTKM